jgi:IS30 family transposase
MRQIRQMLRLARDGVSAREIGRTLGVARSTIQDNLKRAAVAGLAWPSLRGRSAELWGMRQQKITFQNARIRHALLAPFFLFTISNGDQY